MDIRLSARPYTDRCRGILERGEHAVIGFSPFNGYSTPETVDRVVAWGTSHFNTIEVLIPGYEAATTLVAAGVPPMQAVRRTRRELNRLHNAALSALRRMDVPDADSHVHNWTTLLSRPSYKALRSQVSDAYRADPVVQEACRGMARAAVRAVAAREPAEAHIDTAIDYVIAELGVVLGGPAVFGVPSSVFLYHQSVALLERVAAGDISTLPLIPGQGFVELQEAPASATPGNLADEDGSTRSGARAPDAEMASTRALSVVGSTRAEDPDPPFAYPFPAGPLGTPPAIVTWARQHRPVCPVGLPSGDRIWMLTRKGDITGVLTETSSSPSRHVSLWPGDETREWQRVEDSRNARSATVGGWVDRWAGRRPGLWVASIRQ